MSKNDLTLKEIMALQYQLWEENKEKWSPMEPEFGKNFILYMIEEIGEVIAIIKKKGSNKIMNDPEIRAKFIEEMGDVLMYFIDVLNRFGVSNEEFADIYLKKFKNNLKRDYQKQYENIKF